MYIFTARASFGTKKSYVNQKRFLATFLVLCKMSKNKSCESDFRVSVPSPDSSGPWISASAFPWPVPPRLQVPPWSAWVPAMLHHVPMSQHVIPPHHHDGLLCIWFVSEAVCVTAGDKCQYSPVVHHPQQQQQCGSRSELGRAFYWFAAVVPAWPGLGWAALRDSEDPGTRGRWRRLDRAGLGWDSGSLTLYHGHSVVIS